MWLHNITWLSKTFSGKEEAMTIKKRPDSFDFLVMLEFQNKVLKAINIVSKRLQESSIDLTIVSLLLKKCTDQN